MVAQFPPCTIGNLNRSTTRLRNYHGNVTSVHPWASLSPSWVGTDLGGSEEARAALAPEPCFSGQEKRGSVVSLGTLGWVSGSP